jgi:hypothetical protein
MSARIHTYNSSGEQRRKVTNRFFTINYNPRQGEVFFTALHSRQPQALHFSRVSMSLLQEPSEIEAIHEIGYREEINDAGIFVSTEETINRPLTFIIRTVR